MLCLPSANPGALLHDSKTLSQLSQLSYFGRSQSGFVPNWECRSSRTACMLSPARPWQLPLLRPRTGEVYELRKTQKVAENTEAWLLHNRSRFGPQEDFRFRYKAGCRGKSYGFTRVFGGGTSQEAYFDATAGPMVRLQCSLGAFRENNTLRATACGLRLPC